jgi:uncharacterized iron-regulated membrane protein
VARPLRFAALIVHQLAGILLGALITVIGLTGSLIVFRHELDGLLYPHLTQVTPNPGQVGIEEVARAARATLPDRRLHRLLVPQEPGDVWVALMQGTSKNMTERYANVYVDPHSGRVLGVQPQAHNLLSVAEQIHTTLLAGAGGEIAVGTAGIALIVLGVSGLLLWPGWRRWQTGVVLRRSTNPRIGHYDLHKLVGLLSAVLLVLTAASGAALVFFEPVAALLTAVTGELAEPEKVFSTPRGQPLPLDRLQATARTSLPGAQTISIFPARQPTDPVRFRMRFASEIQPNGRSFVNLDAYSGAVLQVQSGLAEPFSAAFFSWAYSLHVGRYGGLITKVLYALAGLAPAVLFWTGFSLWLDRLRRRQCHQVLLQKNR